MRIRVLGDFSVEGVDPATLGSRKARLALKALALARRASMPSGTLVDILWPGVRPRRPEEQISVLVSRMRAVLGPSRLVRTAAGYALAYDWLDVDALEDLAREARERLRAGSLVGARTAAAAALALCRGPLLADEPEAEWAAADRQRAERLELAVRRLGADAAALDGDHLAALEISDRLLIEDPYDEAALRIAMSALAATGRRPSALELYERCRARLDDELGVSPSAETDALHRQLLKDQAQDVTVEAGRQGRHPVGLRRSARLPGREAALDELDRALAEAQAGRAQFVAVEGEQGMGKTHLLRTWIDAVSGRELAVVSGRCEMSTRGLPMQPLLDAIDDHLRQVGRDRATALLMDDRDLLAPMLGSFPGGERIRSSAAPVTDAAYGQTMLFAAILRVVTRIAGDKGVAVTIDDLHFADAATQHWVHYAARRLAHERVLLVVTQWPDLRLSLAGATRIVLQPLDIIAASEVVGPGRAAMLHKRSLGNPLFLVELAATDADGELPLSIREAIEMRCAAAGRAAETLRAAAVLGETVDLDLLAGALHKPAARLLDDLESGVRLKFLEDRKGLFGFRHDLVREALAAGTTPARRALLHREAGRLLAARPDADPLETADHSRLGGDNRAAAAALLIAAATAIDRHAHADALEFASRAAVLFSSPTAHLQRSRALILLGRFTEAGEAAERALAEEPSPAACELAAAAAYYSVRLRHSRALAERGVRLSQNPEQRLGCLVVSGRAHHALGDVTAAGHRLEEAMSVAAETGTAPPGVVLAFLRVHQGLSHDALDILDPASRQTAARHQFAAFTPLHHHFITAYALATVGRAAEALSTLARADEEARTYNIERYMGLADNFRGWILRNLGMTNEADRCNARCRLWARDVGYREAEAYAVLDLADGRLQAADLTSAGDLLTQADPLLAQDYAYAWRNRIRAGFLRSRLALARGDAGTALASSARLLEQAERFSTPRYAALALILNASAAAVCGLPVDEDAVEATLARVESVAGLEAWWITGQLAAARGSVHLRRHAKAFVRHLHGQAGPHQAAFAAHAQVMLDRMSTAGRSG